MLRGVCRATMTDGLSGPVFAAMILKPEDVADLINRSVLRLDGEEWQKIGATGTIVYVGSKEVENMVIEPDGSFTMCLNVKMLHDLIEKDQTFTIDHEFGVYRLRYGDNEMEADLKLKQCMNEMAATYNASNEVIDLRSVTEKPPSLN
jgi:hypothetical protein